MAGNRDQDVAVFIDKGTAIKPSGVGITNPRSQKPAKNANARLATTRPSTRNFFATVCGFAISAEVINGATEPFSSGDF